MKYSEAEIVIKLLERQWIARSTGKTAVCFATSVPGATNLITGIADAKMDSVPIVSITGQVNSSLIGTDAFQEIDTYGLTMPIIKPMNQINIFNMELAVEMINNSKGLYYMLVVG